MALAATLATPAAAQTTDSATTRPEPRFTGNDALVLGAFAAGSIALSAFDEEIVRELRDSSLQRNRRLDGFADASEFVNERSLFAASVFTWGVARIAGQERTADISLHAAEAVLVSSALATVVRGVLGRSRPFVTQGEDPYDFEPGKGFGDLAYRAWPSIHASASFATAAVLTHEIRRESPRTARVVGPVLYAGALLPGLARMYSNKHWASDVLMGAGLGWWTGRKVVRYHHTRDRTRSDRWFLGATGDRGVVVTLRF